MTTARRQRFFFGQAAWMLGTLVVLTLLSSLSLGTFFIVSLIGILVIVELTAAINVRPQWRRRLRWIVLGGLITFGYIIGRRVVSLFPSGL